MKLTVGQTLQSGVDSTSVVIVRAPQSEVTLTCAGAPMFDPRSGSAPSAEVNPSHMNGTLLGKRYTDPEGTIELLCIKGGDGSLAIDGQELQVMAAKPIPSSD